MKTPQTYKRLMSLNNKQYFAARRKGLSILTEFCVFKMQCVKEFIAVKQNDLEKFNE